MEEILVSVICTAYNHEKYIGKALESMLTQKTNFNFEVLVNDDASTDRTPYIIKEFELKYPYRIKAFYQHQNLISQGKSPGKMLWEHAQGKYIAYCEGDDFWTYENKLQKQVDFLEAHNEYSACYHAAYYANEKGVFKKNSYFRSFTETRTIETEELIRGWKFATNSCVYRRSSWKELPIPYKGDCRNGDYARITYLALQGKTYYFDELWSAYRVVSIGSINWTYKTDVEKHKTDMYKLINMLERLDIYSNYQYHNPIEEYKEDLFFSICLLNLDFKGAKKYGDRYSQIDTLYKLKLMAQKFFPKTYNKLKLAKMNWMAK